MRCQSPPKTPTLHFPPPSFFTTLNVRISHGLPVPVQDQGAGQKPLGRVPLRPGLKPRPQVPRARPSPRPAPGRGCSAHAHSAAQRQRGVWVRKQTLRWRCLDPVPPRSLSGKVSPAPGTPSRARPDLERGAGAFRPGLFLPSPSPRVRSPRWVRSPPGSPAGPRSLCTHGRTPSIVGSRPFLLRSRLSSSA